MVQPQYLENVFVMDESCKGMLTPVLLYRPARAVLVQCQCYRGHLATSGRELGTCSPMPPSGRSVRRVSVAIILPKRGGRPRYIDSRPGFWEGFAVVLGQLRAREISPERAAEELGVFVRSFKRYAERRGLLTANFGDDLT